VERKYILKLRGYGMLTIDINTCFFENSNPDWIFDLFSVILDPESLSNLESPTQIYVKDGDEALLKVSTGDTPTSESQKNGLKNDIEDIRSYHNAIYRKYADRLNLARKLCNE